MIITITDDAIRVRAYHDMRKILESAQKNATYDFITLSFEQENELLKIAEDAEWLIQHLAEIQNVQR